MLLIQFNATLIHTSYGHHPGYSADHLRRDMYFRLDHITSIRPAIRDEECVINLLNGEQYLIHDSIGFVVEKMKIMVDVEGSGQS